MVTQSIGARKNYWSLDVAKFLCALTIISAHFASEWGNFPTLLDYVFSIYIIAVPFFFCCSGFLFFRKMDSLVAKEDKKNYFVKYQKRLWIMYGLWSVVYFPVQVYIWGADFKEEFLEFLHRALVIQTYATIWFLPALAIGIAVTYLLVNKLSKKNIVIIAVLLYVFGMLGHTYNFILEGTPLAAFFDGYLTVFKTSRNGLFNAVPFVYMGYLVSKKEVLPSRKGALKYGIGAVISLAGLVAESFVLKIKYGVSGMDIGVFIVPFTYFFIMTALNIELKERKIWLWCRNLSLGIFLSQRIFLSVIPTYLPAVFDVLYEKNGYVGLIIVLVSTIAFSVAMIKGGKRFKFLRYFM